MSERSIAIGVASIGYGEAVNGWYRHHTPGCEIFTKVPWRLILPMRIK